MRVHLPSIEIMLFSISQLMHSASPTEIESCTVTAYEGTDTPFTLNLTYDGDPHARLRIYMEIDLDSYADIQEPCVTTTKTTNLPELTDCTHTSYVILYYAETTVRDVTITLNWFILPSAGYLFGPYTIRVRPYDNTGSNGSWLWCDSFIVASNILYSIYIYIYTYRSYPH